MVAQCEAYLRTPAIRQLLWHWVKFTQVPDKRRRNTTLPEDLSFEENVMLTVVQRGYGAGAERERHVLGFTAAQQPIRIPRPGPVIAHREVRAVDLNLIRLVGWRPCARPNPLIPHNSLQKCGVSHVAEATDGRCLAGTN